MGHSLGFIWRKPFWRNFGLLSLVIFNLVWANILIWICPEWDPGNVIPVMGLVYLTVEVKSWNWLIGWFSFAFILLFERFVVLELVTRIQAKKKQINVEMDNYSDPRDSVALSVKKDDTNYVLMDNNSEEDQEEQSKQRARDDDDE